MKNKVWKNKAARRRGIGIEIALLVMLVTTAMCILLVSTALLEKEGIDSRKAEVLERLALDQIGDDFLAGKEPLNNVGSYEYNGYVVVVETDHLMVYFGPETERMLKLDVTVSNDGSNITGWTYHNLGIGGQ